MARQRIQREIEPQHIDARFADKAKDRRFDRAVDEGCDLIDRQVARGGDARHLQPGDMSGEMSGIQPRARGRRGIGGDGPGDPRGAQGRDRVGRRARISASLGRARVGAGRGRAVIAGTGGGGARPEIALGRRSSGRSGLEPTARPSRTNEAAIGLGRKGQLADAGDGEGIGKAGSSVKSTIMTMAGRTWFSMILTPDARAVTAMSISLMPMNGTTRPPRP